MLFKVLSEKTFLVLVQSNSDAFVHLVRFVCAGVKALGQTIQLDWAGLRRRVPGGLCYVWLV